ncbi:DUF397 domain-containing protein [Allostreptomyces psammosilenae]|uniref:DUF397 domain-containing protein n=1 Tax=Allostreptomyces psammosilenae TaxID=1892865 RepID=A0A853AA81_9ACTN|nr:DUF397 domain-containing protein [Allostreptomyces psammosilenae]NYI07282.1 hypothetical protein [Allostreptomyces psammosilenae]
MSPDFVWIASSYSGPNNNCVEWAPKALPVAVPVRDSKNPDGPTLTFSRHAWAAFVESVKSGRIS